MSGTTIDARATISLAPGVILDRGRLKDEMSGTEYPVVGLGPEVLERMVNGEPVGDVTLAVAEKYDVSEETVAGDIETFIGQLDSQGLISTRQSYLLSIRAFLLSIAAAAPSPLDLLMLDTSKLAQPTRRYPPTLAFVVVACLEAQVMLFLGGAALVALAVSAKMVAAWQQHEDAVAVGVFAAARPVLAIGIFALLFMCHEAGHLIALRALRMKVRSVAARMWAVGITYVPGTPLENLLVAIAGPLAAFAAALALALLLSAHPQNALGVGNLEVSYIILFGLLHLWSLRPWAGDGRQAAGAIFTMGRGTRATANRKGAT